MPAIAARFPWSTDGLVCWCLHLWEETAVLFTSDHGFYFGEHGLFGKRRFRWPDDTPFEEGFARGWGLSHGLIYRSPLHREITQVPLLLYLPGAAPGRVRGLVTLPDLMPTILDMTGARVPERVLACSLVPLIRGETARLHDIVVTSAPLEEQGDMTRTVDDRARQALEISPSTITDGEWDLLYAVHGDPVELYHGAADPAHGREVSGEHPEIVASLHDRFVRFLEQAGTPERNLAPRRQV